MYEKVERLAGTGGLILLGIATLVLGYGPERAQFYPLAIAWAAGFLGLLLLRPWSRNGMRLHHILFIGLGLRLLLLFSFPTLSDDIYRFLWDGHCLHQGIDPFAYTPRQLMESDLIPAEEWRPLFELLNSPDYFSVYPPLSQALFFLVTTGSGPDQLWLPTILLRLLLLTGETGTMILLYLLLKKTGLPTRRLLLYAANPLVIIEISGNLHFEGFILLGLLASLYLYRTWPVHQLDWKKTILLPLPFAAAVATKLTPLILLPYLWFQRSKPIDRRLFLLLALQAGILLSPLLLSLLQGGFLSSLDLYFRRFEFNASFYYLVRAIGKYYLGHNPIQLAGPILGLIGLGSIVFLSWRQRLTLPQYTTLPVVIYTLFLALSTTVHPWYVLIPLGLSVLSPLYYPLVWSALVFTSYAAYQQSPPKEILCLIGLSYLIVYTFAFWELRKGYSQAR